MCEYMCRYVAYTESGDDFFVSKEHSIYGSSRLGLQTRRDTLYQNTAITPDFEYVYRDLGTKQYELSIPIAIGVGNVLATVTDQHKPIATLSTIDSYEPVIVSISDYYPFGSAVADRSWSDASRAYRYGFNLQEKDDEVAGVCNSYSAEFWQYDSRIGRRWNLDPRPSHSNSNYTCFLNNPIWFVDLFGDTISVNGLKNETGPLKDAAKTNVSQQVNDGVFAVFAHSSSRGITFQLGDGTEIRCKNAKEFNKYMYENCKEWREAIDNGTKITLILYSCNAASNTYYDNYYGHGLIKTNTTIAQDISKFLYDKNKESVVKAIDGYGAFSDKDGKFLGARQQLEEKVENTFEGGFVTIINGEKKYKLVYAYTGKSTPKKRKKKPVP